MATSYCFAPPVSNSSSGKDPRCIVHTPLIRERREFGILAQVMFDMINVGM